MGTIRYPGVYVEEIPAGPRPIEGVATSVAAFVGRTLRGPVDRPGTIASYAEFERCYGGLWSGSTLPDAVRLFFLNGGRQATVCRLHRGARAATLTLPGGLALSAASPGAWGNRLRIRVEHAPDAGARVFSLVVKDTAGGSVERFDDLSTDPAEPRFVARVLEASSQLVRVAGPVPAVRPDAHGAAATGSDGLDDPGASTAFAATGSDGAPLRDADVAGRGLEARGPGLWLLEGTPFNLLCIPPLGPRRDVGRATWDAAAVLAARRGAMLLVDAPRAWRSAADASDTAIDALISPGTHRTNVALYFPRLVGPDPRRRNRPATFAACGAVAGVYARTDAQRGVWKAPAGTEATIAGATSLGVALDDAANDDLNVRCIGVLRALDGTGIVVWGARTLGGNAFPEWKYVPVRRLALFIEQSIAQGTRWAAFEPNGEPLWARLRASVAGFLHDLHRQGALQGPSSRDAWFVKCDASTTTQADIDAGAVNLVVGFAAIRPAEFIVLHIRQQAGGT